MTPSRHALASSAAFPKTFFVSARSGFGGVLARRVLLTLLAFFGAASLGACLHAQEPGELVTDRPDQTESAAVVAPGYVQVESGWFSGREEEGGVREEVEAAPGTLVRIGLTETLELRLGWSGWERSEVSGPGFREVIDGAGDGELGFKLRLADEAGARPEMALLVSTSVPVGERGLSSERFDPSARLSLAHTFSERLSLGYNLGVSWASEETPSEARTTLGSGLYTVALGIGLSPRWGAFLEAFGEVPLSAEGGLAHGLDGGFTFLVKPNLQFDVFAGAGLSNEALDSFVGFGFSLRLPG